MRRPGLLSASGVILLVVIVMMTLHEWGNPLEGDNEAFLSAPAITAENIVARQFNRDSGEVEYRLLANNLEQYEREALTLLDHPDLSLNNGNNQWTIQADNGEVRDNGDLIVFENNVEAVSKNNGVTLDTRELHYLSGDRQVSAPDTVHMRHSEGSTRAGSMDADLDTGRMTLKQGVVSEFKGPKP